MSNFKPARPTKIGKRTRSLPPVTVHVFVPSGDVTATVHPEAICTCGSAWSSRVHDRRSTDEIYTEVDQRRIGEGQ